MVVVVLGDGLLINGALEFVISLYTGAGKIRDRSLGRFIRTFDILIPFVILLVLIACYAWFKAFASY